jgi:hypothetical protein
MGTEGGERTEAVIGRIAHPNLLVVLWLHTAVNPGDEEWDRACSQIVEWRRAHGSDTGRLRQLVISDGGAPNARQRSRSRVLQAGQPTKIAVVTTVLANPIKRGVATALTWVNPSFRFYEPAGIAKALQYLDIANHASAVKAEFEKLELQLGIVKALRMMPWHELL